MKVNDIFLITDPVSLVDDSTMVYIQEGSNIVSRAHWYHDNILRFHDYDVISFSYNSETHTVRIKVRGEY